MDGSGKGGAGSPGDVMPGGAGEPSAENAITDGGVGSFSVDADLLPTNRPPVSLVDAPSSGERGRAHDADGGPPHPFAIPDAPDAGCHAARPGAAEPGLRVAPDLEDGLDALDGVDAGLLAAGATADVSSKRQCDWEIGQFLQGIEDARDAPSTIIARVLSDARPAELDEYAWCLHLAENPTRLRGILGQSVLADRMAEGLGKQMRRLAQQSAATAAELNDKFLAQGDAFSFGQRDLFDGGLAVWIGVPDTVKPMEEMYAEHNCSVYASESVVASNYGVETDAIREWAAAAGEWTPVDRSHRLKAGFQLPPETRNMVPEHMRAMVCLDDFMQPPAPDEELRWNMQSKKDWGGLSPPEQARRCVHKAKLQAAEVLALRLWSGPMYYSYNAVLRGGVKGKFTTTLHVLVSAIIKVQ